MLFLWICLLFPLAWASPLPVSELEEAVDVLLTTMEAHEKKIKNLQEEMYNIGDVLEKQAFLLKHLEEIVEDKKDPGYTDDVGQEEVREDEVEDQVLSDELKKIRDLKDEANLNIEKEYVDFPSPAEVVEEEMLSSSESEETEEVENPEEK
ncbi:uncharacterized protein LOC133200939 [Saccostrea echinata]|uniref:uncharacterized protein LOC133200939 n=1 Tax=Saccostrea echinata TaxID=191078 RepID=UPI002A804EB6|nr:uncharacterized protein LOC133200939 [Saccostrea echinata]